MSNVLVCGGAHIDRRGRIAGATAPGASNPGSWFVEAGGGGFNAARNLARLGMRVRMISPRGGDADGEAVAEAAFAAGIQDTPFTFLDRKTPSYTAILENDGNLVVALADMDLYRLFTPRRLAVRAVREAIAMADLVLCDANLPEETIATLTARAKTLGKTVAAIAISPAKVVRYRKSLGAIDVLFMNEAEAAALTGERIENADAWPDILQAAGLAGGVVTRGRQPLIAFSGDSRLRLTPPLVETIRDVTGAGDSLAAGVLFGLMAGLPLSEAVRQGAAAALLTLQSPFAAAETLSPQALRDTLGLVPLAEILS